MTWGFVSKEDKAIQLVAQRKILYGKNKGSSLSSKETKKALARKIYAQEYSKQSKKFLKKEAQYKLGLKKRPPIISREQVKSSLSSL